ncbi:MAG: alpha/beta hydrolase [Rhodospirillales bacterium]|nr:alpha/beta hydrolase [Rhodospirillales bacterium]
MITCSRRSLVLAGAGIVGSSCMPVVIPSGVASMPPEVSGERLIASDGTLLPLRSWQPADHRPPRAAIIALHGFNDYSKFFGEAGAWFAERGITSYAFDQRGFGESPMRGYWAGKAAMADDLASAIIAVRKRHPETPIYLLGESMGGAVVMVLMARPDPPPVNGIILLAPAIWGRSSMPWYQTLALWLAAHTIPGGSLSGRGLGIRASDNIEMLRERGQDPLVIKQTRVDAVFGLVNLMDQAMAATPALSGRMLLLYGKNDQLIPQGAMVEMVTRLPVPAKGDHRLGFYPNGWHMLLHDLQRQTVWDDIAAFISDPEQPLPSGAEQEAALWAECAADARC